MSPMFKLRIRLSAYSVLIATIAVSFFFNSPIHELVIALVLAALSVPIGIIISGLTEPYLSKPAERLMNILTGFGAKGQDAEFDEQGVPVVSLRRLGEKFYNPVAVAMAAFRYYDDFQTTGSAAALASFRNCNDSLVDNLVIQDENGFGVWQYSYPFSYGLVPPWISGLAQGVGIQVLSRCYRMTGDDKYYEAARSALGAFFKSVDDGGVTYMDDEDSWWYEEFVGSEAKVSRVLNGMIYAILGIREYQENTGDGDAEILYEKGIICLRKNLAKYDAGWWTYYDVLGTVATKSYHNVHIDLIRQMYDLTSDQVYLDAYRRWSGYRAHFFVREFWRSRPSWHDVVILSLNIAGVWLALRIGVVLWEG